MSDEVRKLTITLKEKDPLLKFIAQKIDDLNKRDIYIEIIYSDSITLTCHELELFLEGSKIIKKFLETGEIEREEMDYQKIREQKMKANENRRNNAESKRGNRKVANHDFPSENATQEETKADNKKMPSHDMDKFIENNLGYKPRTSLFDGL